MGFEVNSGDGLGLSLEASVSARKPSSSFFKFLPENGPWKVLAIIGFCVLSVTLFVCLLLGIIEYSFHHSDIYNYSLATVKENKRVIHRVGTPITPKYFISGSINIQNDTGDANLEYVVFGPKGELTIHAIGKRKISIWQFTKLTAEGDDVLEFDLLAPKVESIGH